MTIALLTRGYIYPRQTGVSGVVFEGPMLTGVTSEAPDITGSGVSRPEGPSLAGAAVSGPNLAGRPSGPPTPADDSPTIVGSGTQKPDVGG
jgi:hypothetical protein